MRNVCFDVLHRSVKRDNSCLTNSNHLCNCNVIISFFSVLVTKFNVDFVAEMPRRDDRYSRNSDRRNDKRHHNVDPEYDARTYASPPENHRGSYKSDVRPALVDYDYASDDSGHKSWNRKRSPSHSPSSNRRDKKESKKSKKKKKSRSNSRDRDSSRKSKSRRRTSISPSDRNENRRSPQVERKKLSPPRQYAQNSLSPPRAYQTTRRYDNDGDNRSARSRERSPLFRRSSPSNSPFGYVTHFLIPNHFLCAPKTFFLVSYIVFLDCGVQTSGGKVNPVLSTCW